MKKLGSCAAYSGLRRSLAAKRLPLEPSRVLKRSDLLFGYELEVEGFDLNRNDKGHATMADTKFSITGDGSLRGDNAFELVSRPMGGKLAVRNLRNVCKWLNEPDAELFSYRCSTHIHLNLLDMDIEHLPSMGLLTILCDNMLFEAGGGQRELNYNSRPISLVSKELEAVALWARNPEVEDVRIDPHARYIGTNWAAIEKFGTAEFRHFPGCSDSKLLIWWTNLLCRMYSHAEARSIDELMEISVEGHKALGRAVFGDDYAKLESARAADDWYATMEAATAYVSTLARPAVGDRDTLHGFMQAEYLI